MQEQEFLLSERKIEINQDSNQENLFSINIENKGASKQAFNIDTNIATKQEKVDTFINPSSVQENNHISGSFISFISSEVCYPLNLEEKKPKLKKKRRCL